MRWPTLPEHLDPEKTGAQKALKQASKMVIDNKNSQLKSAPIPTEHQEQAWLFEWAESAMFHYPALWGLAAIPNGGRRAMKTAKELKAEGVKPGFPDINLPEPRGQYHGLFIELKRRKNYSISADQKAWAEYLTSRGYFHAFCFGWEHAQRVILNYLNLPMKP